ncbi:MAG: DUF262 domain-containing protein [Pirellulales bacterium]
MTPPRFKVAAFEARTLSWWKGKRAKIDMEPPYQRRGRLWSDSDKAYLIDSILNGFDVPKVYLADFTWADSTLNEKKLPYAIIDGKQRFESIFDFFDGKITLNNDFVYREDPSLDLQGLSYQDLRQNYAEIAEVFETFNLSVMSVIAETNEQINDLFVRLNRSKPLTGAEIRNAMAGPAPEVIREIAKHEFFDSTISFKVERGQDLNAAAKILMFEYNSAPRDTKKSTLDAFVRETEQVGHSDQLELAGRRVLETLDEMSAVFLPRDRLLSSAGVIPVYYWFIGELPTKELPKVREFLTRFEGNRAENRRLLSEAPRSRRIDSELVEYDNYNRSTNDEASHTSRIDVLQRRFREFLVTKRGSR